MQSIPFIAWCLEHLNYWTITLLMTIESSFIPFPSEVVVPPGAYKSAVEGSRNPFRLVIFATIGAALGALINYSPAVRQLISIPAGLAKMNVLRFLFYTTLGAGIWNSILCGLGWYIGHNYSGQLEEKIALYSGELKICMLILGVAAVGYLIYKGMRK